MKKKLTIYLMLLSLMCSLAVSAGAEEVATDNTCGENLTWTFADGVLTVTGEGAMEDYLEGAPWAAYQNEIQSIVFTGGVTYIGAYAFRDYDSLTDVDFGDAVVEIGMEAFRECDGLTAVSLPASFEVFGESCFEACPNLTEIHCAGGFPSFRQDSMWNTSAVIYFPADAPWDVELVQQLEEAFGGRIEFLASDGSDPYVPTEAATEAPATVPPTTEAPTVPTTEAPETEAAETMAPQPTETQPVEQEKKGGFFGDLLVILGVIAVILIGAVVMILSKGKKKKGKFDRK